MTTKRNEPRRLIYPPITEIRDPDFPSVEYFHIHFEHLENQLDQHRLYLEKMQAQITELSLRLTLSRPESFNHRVNK